MAETAIYKDNQLSDYITGQLYTNWANDRRILLEDKWNKNRAGFIRDVATFDSLAGVWRTYQADGPPVPATEEEFLGAEADLPEQEVDWHSKTFMPIIKNKVVAGGNLVNDQMFRGNKIPFQFDVYVSDYANEEEWKIVNAKRQNAETRIIEMLQKTKAIDQMRLTVNTAALYGEGYYKKTTETITSRSTRVDADGEMVTDIDEEEYLSGENVSNWNIFRDLQFENIDDGDGIIHRDFVSPATLRGWAEEGEEFFWIPEAIDAALKSVENKTFSGAGATPLDTVDTTSVSPRVRDLETHSASNEYLECWVRVPTIYVDKFENLIDGDTDDEIDGYYSYVLCGIFNNYIIRFARVEQGDHPFFNPVWEVDVDGFTGIGIADNVENDQKVLNGMVRNWEDNAKLASNLIIASNKLNLDGDYKNWYPGKDIQMKDVKNINEAIQQLQIQDVGGPLLNGITMFMQFADMSSNIPREQQGMPSDNPQTAFEVQQRLERSGKYIGTVISEFDKRLLEPFIADCYEWLSLQPGFDDLGGAFKVNALGFSSYEARVLRQQSLMTIYALTSQNPEYARKVSADYFLKEIARSNSLPPEEFVKSDEKLAEEEQARLNSPEVQLQMRTLALQVEELSAKVDKTRSEAELNQAKADNLDAETDITDKTDQSTVIDPAALAEDAFNF